MKFLEIITWGSVPVSITLNSLTSIINPLLSGIISVLTIILLIKQFKNKKKGKSK